MGLVKLLIVVVLIAIIISLGSGMFFLVRDRSDSRRTVRALTVRIALSIALFALLFIAWYAGLLRPHPLGG